MADASLAARRGGGLATGCDAVEILAETELDVVCESQTKEVTFGEALRDRVAGVLGGVPALFLGLAMGISRPLRAASPSST